MSDAYVASAMEPGAPEQSGPARLRAVPTPRTPGEPLTGPDGQRRAAHLLLVEDSKPDARLIAEMLSEAGLGWTVTHVDRVRDAAQVLGSQPVDCVLLDLSVVDADGLEGLAAITQVAPTMAVVVLTRASEDLLAERALQSGAQDYLGKRGLDGAALTRAVRYAIERKATELRIAHQAMHDPLTGLPNRALFDDRLQLATAERYRPLAVLFIDLDEFKDINDSLGHQAGDLVLLAVADRLGQAVRAGDTVARFAGDEFTVLAPHLHSPAEAGQIAERIRAALAQPLQLAGREHIITASVGLTISLSEDDDASTLLSQADAALYRAKRLGKNRVAAYDERLRVEAMTRFTLTRQLAAAIDRDELRLLYQPETDLRTGAVPVVEALLRWQHPSRGLLAPDEFLGLAEDSGLIVPIGAWVFAAACRQRRQWEAHRTPGGAAVPVIAVNVSAVQLADPAFLTMLTGVLSETGCPPAGLQLEITETALLDTEGLTRVLTGIRELGLALCIDDFGTGFSSLNYLKLFPATTVKIDMSFVAGIGTNPTDEAIAQAVISVGHSLRMTVVAEGVETPAQAAWLRDVGCDLGQGYLFARPSAADQTWPRR